MKIALKHDQPISWRPRRLSFADKESVQKILDELLEKKIIRPSNSPYANPIVLVQKKTGDVRLCVDFCELNKITIRDNFLTELVDDNIDRLRNKKYFSVLDLKDGFHHVKMHEESINFTSFVTPLEIRVFTNVFRIDERIACILTFYTYRIRGTYKRTQYTIVS